MNLPSPDVMAPAKIARLNRASSPDWTAVLVTAAVHFGVVFTLVRLCLGDDWMSGFALVGFIVASVICVVLLVRYLMMPPSGDDHYIF